MEDLVKKMATLDFNKQKPSTGKDKMGFSTDRSKKDCKSFIQVAGDKRRAADVFIEEQQISKKLETRKTSANDEKLMGNFAYGEKNFEKALRHYKEAIRLDPGEITYYINIAAVHFENKHYEECVGQCLKGIDIGLVHKADPCILAKAYTRAAKASIKLSRYNVAKDFCEKALEHDNHSEASNLLHQVEKKIIELRKRCHIDPIKAEDENDLGNKFYREEKYYEALKHFTEAVKCSPNNPGMFINRAACLAKVEKFKEALKDVDTSIKLDENIIQSYILKGKILERLSRTADAKEAFKKALEIDPKNAIALFGSEQNTPPGNIQLKDEKLENRKEKDKGKGEHQNIELDLDDPELRDIFQAAYENPGDIALQLSNPKVAQTIQKLFYDS